jgi:hypothetical protein
MTWQVLARGSLRYRRNPCPTSARYPPTRIVQRLAGLRNMTREQERDPGSSFLNRLVRTMPTLALTRNWARRMPSSPSRRGMWLRRFCGPSRTPRAAFASQAMRRSPRPPLDRRRGHHGAGGRGRPFMGVQRIKRGACPSLSRDRKHASACLRLLKRITKEARKGRQRPLCALCKSKPPAVMSSRGLLASDRVSCAGKLRKAGFRLDRRAFYVNAGGRVIPAIHIPALPLKGAVLP